MSDAVESTLKKKIELIMDLALASIIFIAQFDILRASRAMPFEFLLTRIAVVITASDLDESLHNLSSYASE